MDKTKKRMQRIAQEHLAAHGVNSVSNGYLPATPHPALSRPRIGAVRYLNAKPLWYPLGDSAEYDHPVAVAQRLHNHELDVANVPLMECLENPGYLLVDGYGVCCRGPVYSVVVSHTVPFSEIKTIALDQASKTSVALLHVLCRRILNHPVQFRLADVPADAHLHIGDQAMAYRKSHPKENYLDLGAAWFQLTKLPFVFAVWAMHDRPDARAIANYLRAIAEKGIAARASFAQSREEYHYLTHNVRYELRSEEKRGIQLFSQYLADIGLIKKTPTLNWI